MSKPPELSTRVGTLIEDVIHVMMTPEKGEEQLSRFDALLAIRNHAVATINTERPQELERLKDIAATLKKALAGTGQRLKDVSIVTKPRGAREKKKESGA